MKSHIHIEENKKTDVKSTISGLLASVKTKKPEKSKPVESKPIESAPVESAPEVEIAEPVEEELPTGTIEFDNDLEEMQISSFEMKVDPFEELEAEVMPVETNSVEAMPKTKSLIASDIEIRGDIVAAGDLEIMGTVTGNVSVQGDLLVKGALKGNVEAGQITLDGGNIAAESIQCTGRFVAINEAVVAGNIQAETITIGATITGNLSAKENCYVNSNAKIIGDIKAHIFSVEQGAILSGKMESTSL